MSSSERGEVERFIQALKGEGYSKVRSIAGVAEAFGVGLDCAKRWVHESRAWSEQKQAHDAFVDQVVETLESKDGKRG